MAHFILVHGMFHGGWCWDRLKRRLEADGHNVYAPDLAGCGADRTPPETVTLQHWAESIAELVRSAPSPAIVVGHSRGGLVISQAAELASDRIAALVYLTAILLPDGAAPMSLPQIMQEQGFVDDRPFVAPRVNAERTAMLPPEGAEELFYGPCSAEDRAWGAPQIGHEPIAPLMTPLAISEERWGSIPRVYIETTDDRVLPIAAQRAMVARSGATEVHSLAADHMPILTHVEELAAMLDDIAHRYGKASRLA
jgi:pimeloyl-ACP methyl ester carboxylesterase